MVFSQIGLIGLGTMGGNLARNIAAKGFVISVYNRTPEVTTEFVRQFGSDKLVAFQDLHGFVMSMEKPRKIMILVKAGSAVNSVIEQLIPLLEAGDIVLDLGNSHYRDTQRREELFSLRGFQFVGCGISGGEEGALHGPSLMPGGDLSVWPLISPVLESIAAKDFEGRPCVTFFQGGGAGHFVKMVHNGIEYAIIQMLAESYDILRASGMSAPEISEVFKKLNSGSLRSYLIEIATQVLAQKDDIVEGYLVDKILDRAGQKGTGAWTVESSFHYGIATPSIAAAVFARVLSGEKSLRIKLSAVAKGISSAAAKSPITEVLSKLESALYTAILVAYAEGFHLLIRAAREEKWSVDLSEVARIWQGGCIIRSQILSLVRVSLQKNSSAEHLFQCDGVRGVVSRNIGELRTIVEGAAHANISTPSLSAALSYVHGIMSVKSSANFIQGLRDYFGAHGYERTDKEGTFHTKWNQA
ncbi:MAG: NADP-dependent phosphogluconate dehydrogenase [Patescibacteria group bacterium]